MKKMFSHFFIALYLFGFKAHKKLVQWLISTFVYSKIISEAFWMSVLSKKSIAAIDEHHYSRSKKYNDEAFNRSLLNEWEDEMVNKYFSQCKNIMVLASGGGREVYALLKKGFNAEGYESNAQLVGFSQGFFRKEGLNALIEHVAPSHCPDNDKIYDGIILGWGAYNHVRGKNVRINFLKEINTHLSTGSPFLISYWHTNEMMYLYCKRLYIVNKFFCKIFRTEPIEEGDCLQPFSGHYFSTQAVAEELQQAGFSVVFDAARPYGYIVAQKS